MQIQYERYMVGAVRVDHVSCSQGIGHARMNVGLSITPTQATNGSIRVDTTTFHGAIYTADGKHVADFLPQTEAWYANSTSMSVGLSSTLEHRTLEILNARREGPSSDVNLVLRLNVDLQGSAGWKRSSPEIPHRIPSSDWLRLLSQAGHATYAVFEVATDGTGVPVGLAKAAEMQATAIAKLSLCEWDAAIAASREVYDEIRRALGPSEPDPSWADFANQAKTAWQFPERLAAIRMMVRHATHNAHHGGHTHTPDEARYIVALAGLALRRYSKLLS